MRTCSGRRRGPGPSGGHRYFHRDRKDFTIYGDEVKFGGGKVIRDGMGQSPGTTRREGALDLVITNAVILDHWGIVKGGHRHQGWKNMRDRQGGKPRYLWTG